MSPLPLALWFSPTAAKRFGTFVYRTLTGEEVDVTVVGDPGAWSDAVRVGDTAGDYSGFVRSNRRERGMVR